MGLGRKCWPYVLASIRVGREGEAGQEGKRWERRKERKKKRSHRRNTRIRSRNGGKNSD